uniref:Myosin light chain 10 n=1 Tax=Chinchilla lanigera TaxID=34839 RepID=A0A8C2VHK9_CHILA
MFDQSQIQEFKEAFTIMDQNRDGFIDKEDLRDTFAALGRINVKNEELEAMVKEAPGPINFTVFLTMFGEKLKGEWLKGQDSAARTRRRPFSTPSRCSTPRGKGSSRLTCDLRTGLGTQFGNGRRRPGP